MPIWDPSQLTSRFNIPRNAGIVAYLLEFSPSAHSDVTLEMQLSADGLSGAIEYAPDQAHYSYVLLHTPANVIFAVSSGMRYLRYKIPAEIAVTLGAEPEPEYGRGWFRFNPFDPHTPRKDIRAAMRTACSTALAAAASNFPL